MRASVIVALAIVAYATALEHACLPTLQCIVDPLGLPTPLAEVDIDETYTKTIGCLQEAGCNVAQSDSMFRFKRSMPDLEGINKTCAAEVGKNMAKKFDQCLSGSDGTLTTNDKVIRLYMVMKACPKDKVRKAGLCLIKDLDIDVNAIRENAANMQPCPCVAEMSDECKQEISNSATALCGCASDLITVEGISKFEEKCGALNDGQRTKITEWIEKIHDKCENPVQSSVDDIKKHCSDLTDFSLPAAN